MPTAAQVNARFCRVLLPPPLPLGVSFAWYGQIKLSCRYVRTCALQRKPKSTFLTEHLLVSSRLHEIDFRLSEIKRTFCLLFELKVQAALEIF